MVREVAGNEGLAHFPAVFGDGDQEFKAVGEASEDLADVEHADLPADRGDSIRLQRLPEPVAGEVAEGQVGVVLVVVFLDDQETGGEPVADFLAPGNVIRRGQALVDQVKRRHQQQRFVGLFVRRTLLNRRGANVQVVKSFDGGSEKHDTQEWNI